MEKTENAPAREQFRSRLGYILVSAGCAVGIGNVWKFPYLCGEYGGAAFILLYLLFLVLMGIPVMVCEFAIGRKSRQSAATALDTLEPKGTKWHKLKWVSIVGNFTLMMFYTSVSGWFLDYGVRSVRGEFTGASPDAIAAKFTSMLGNTGEMTFFMVLVCIIGFTICYFGIQKGVEKVTKFFMIGLVILMVALAIHSVTLEGANAGLRFYLIPDFSRMSEQGLGNVIFAAMSQAFFTLSIGIGALLIFGSYMGKEKTLTGEATIITLLDTFVALMSGFIIIPACFAYGIQPDAGPSLIFITIPNLFAKMPGGRVWSGMFFVFLAIAALSTVVAVFENIIAFFMDMKGWTRRKSTFVSAVLIIILSMPCVLGFNVLSGFQPLGAGTNVLDLEDFIVSNNLLPLGSLAFVLFCTRKNGWGWDGFIKEANTGTGVKFSEKLKGYMSYVLPALIIVIYLKGYYDKFAPLGRNQLIFWLIAAILFLSFILGSAFYTGDRKRQKENA